MAAYTKDQADKSYMAMAGQLVSLQLWVQRVVRPTRVPKSLDLAGAMRAGNTLKNCWS